ncbi:MAG: hypothetical protein AUI47_01430 [Acidobacteria bacterium 13_1_40CM_2_68_5]|nr:MAG: hypothetical protein AUI47_01430 [Acidobacteria bacterium 13_1_40CM_2_68_5]
MFHSRAWLEPLRRTYGYEPIGYTTSPPSAELANGLVFCRIDSWLTGRRLVSLPFSDHTQPLADSEEDLHDVLGFLNRGLKRGEWKYIELRPLDESAGNSAGFEKSGVFYFHRMDLRPPLEVLFRNFHKSCTQRKIRRAEREALTYEEGRSEILLHKFYQLLLMTCRRKRLPPQPIAWFRHLIASVGDRLKIHLASKADRPIAAIITVSFKRSILYKYGCSDARFNSLGGTHFLLWKAIQDAKRNDLHEFDLGRSDLHTPGLVAFKDHWATTRSVINYLRCSISPTAPVGTGWTMRIAQQLFARMPEPFLIAAGKTLYRHIG